MKSPIRLLPSIGFALCAVAAGAHAAWPDDKPIEVIVGYAPGGANDLMARVMAPFMEKQLGGKAKLIVINRPGASGEIGWAALQRAAPDGYTIALISTPSFLTNTLQRKTQYDPAQIVPLARIMDDPALFITIAASPLNSLADVVRKLKASPEGISMGTSGIATNGHMAALALLAATGAKVNDVPFKGSGEARTALAGGHIDMAVMGGTEFLQAGRTKELKALAQLARTRHAFIGDIPTAREQGLDIVISSERGFGAPRGLPPDVQSRLEKAIEETLRDPEFLKRVSIEANTVAYQSGAEWAKRMPEEKRKFETLWKFAPVQQ